MVFNEGRWILTNIVSVYIFGGDWGEEEVWWWRITKVRWRAYSSKSPQSNDPPVTFESAGNVTILTLSLPAITRSPVIN